MYAKNCLLSDDDYKVQRKQTPKHDDGVEVRYCVGALQRHMVILDDVCGGGGGWRGVW